MAAGNRLTREQLAALAISDTVTIETGSDLDRSRHTSGTVVRTGPSYVVVSVAGPRGGTSIERYGVRDGLRDSGRAELVTIETRQPRDPGLVTAPHAEHRRRVPPVEPPPRRPGSAPRAAGRHQGLHGRDAERSRYMS